jgi:acetyltransferase-like isoleucine patch superfamily enzyme
MNRPSFARRLWRELCSDLWQATGGVFINALLGSAVVPRPVRWLGYRMLGARIQTPNVSAGFRVMAGLRLIEIGPGTFLNQRCVFEAIAPIRIGADCAIGPEVMIVTSHHTRDSTGRLSAEPVGRDVVIGDRVWLGARSMILPGARIGDDVVIGAGSVVAGRCEEPGIYAGAPARWVRPLYDVKVA